MKCEEYQELLPEMLDGGETPEGKLHTRSCAECLSLYSELLEISQAAVLLRAGEEPSQRVWNSIEIALRQEGLIREPLVAGPSLVRTRASSWRLAWLAPIAALLLVMTSGVMMYQHRAQPVADTNRVATIDAGPEDQEILNAVGERTPGLRATYAADLQHINAYIHTAEDSVKNDPTDEEAQRALMGAYEQRSMVYEMAYERPLP